MCVHKDVLYCQFARSQKCQFSLSELQFQLVMQDLAVGERKGDIIGGERPQEVKIIQGSAAEEIKELESCLLSLQAELHEAKSRNIFLAELIEQQKRYFFHDSPLWRWTSGWRMEICLLSYDEAKNCSSRELRSLFTGCVSAGQCLLMVVILLIIGVTKFKKRLL